MKRFILSVLVAGAMAWVAYGQGNQQRRVAGQPGVPMVFGGPQQQEEVDLPRFDLDFQAGRPGDLVEAIREKIPGGVLNAIIPNEYATVQLPPMKLKGVNVKQLFEALEFATQKQVQYQSGFQTGGGPGGQAILTTTTALTTFRTTPPITPESVWYFHVSKPQPVESPKTVRYYQLGLYLTQYKIDDITTAIQTGWKMLGEASQPEALGLNFHEDTKLLIAVGPVGQLNIIDSVLAELNKGLPAETREKVRVTGKPEPSPSK